MEKIRNKGCFPKSVAYCKADVPVAGGQFKSQRADVADRDEWVEECGDKKKWEEDVGDKDERELRERENICITNPVCCYAVGQTRREAKSMFTIICVRLRRQYLNKVLVDNLLWHCTGTLTLNSRTILMGQNQQQGTCADILATFD